MKKLFYLVLVINAGFFIWILTQQDESVHKTDAVVVQKPTLALLEEAGTSASISASTSGSAAVTNENTQTEGQPVAKPETMAEHIEVKDEDSQGVSAQPVQKETEVADVVPPQSSESVSSTSAPVVPAAAQAKNSGKLAATPETGISNMTANHPVEKIQQETINCFELGSFPTMVVADKISTQFRNAGIWAESRLDIQEQKQGQIIYIPTQGSYDRANQIIALAKEKGITDYAILPVDGVRNTVVMGIYRTDTAAARRLEQLKGHGFDARIKEHIRKRPRYMVDFRESDSKPVPDELWSRISHDYPKVNRAVRTCE